tara:strand:- start:1126 stop:1344 length:219 start_codon:yes stop_codon:yes gene_type:complete
MINNEDIENNNFLEDLQREINSFSPKNLDINTEKARMNYTSINVKSINIQTMILSIILVILVTIAFMAHLKN